MLSDWTNILIILPLRIIVITLPLFTGVCYIFLKKFLPQLPAKGKLALRYGFLTVIFNVISIFIAMMIGTLVAGIASLLGLGIYHFGTLFYYAITALFCFAIFLIVSWIVTYSIIKRKYAIESFGRGQKALWLFGASFISISAYAFIFLIQ